MTNVRDRIEKEPKIIESLRLVGVFIFEKIIAGSSALIIIRGFLQNYIDIVDLEVVSIFVLLGGSLLFCAKISGYFWRKK